MNLESLLKFHFPKTTQLSDSPHGTSPDALSVTDVMASMGMTQSRVALGYSAFLGKMEISNNDQARALNLLFERAMMLAPQYPHVWRLGEEQRDRLLRILCVYAFEDYARSAATKTTCKACNGDGFIRKVITRRVYKNGVYVDLEGTEDILCKHCKGKGVTSCACRDCKGRGKVLDREASNAAEQPVFKTCTRCGGVGYQRLKRSVVHKAICDHVIKVSHFTWWTRYRPLFEELITELDKQEAAAESAIQAITKREDD